MVLKVYDIKKNQQSDLHFAGSFCLVYQAKLTNSKRYILHICDYEGKYDDLTRFVSYPGQIINAPCEVADQTFSLQACEQLFKRPAMGGLYRKGVILEGSSDEVAKEIYELKKSLKGKRFILGGNEIMGNVKIPLFKKADLDASIGVFFDGFSKVIVAIAILVGTFGLDGGTVFGTMMPGVLVSVIVLNGGLWLYYRHIAKQRGDSNLTAIPAGLQAGRMFIWLFSIMLPVFNSTGDAFMAFKVGVLAHFIGGAVFIIGAFVVPKILKIVPAGALFGSLAGGAMAFLILQSMDGTLKLSLIHI